MNLCSVFVQAEGEDRRSPEQIGQFYVRNDAGTMVPLSAVQSTSQMFGPQFTNRFNVYRAAQITGAAAPGYSSGQAMAALEEVARQTLPRDIGYDWSDLSYQERQASGTTGLIFGLSLVFRVYDLFDRCALACDLFVDPVHHGHD